MTAPDSTSPSPIRRGARVMLGTLAVFALLVALHLGEFWPFSMYPMFSQAGEPWSRAVVRTLPPDTDAVSWDTLSAEALPGSGYALSRQGVDAIDLANYVSKTPVWDASARAGLERLFHDQLDDQALLILRARGRLNADRAAELQFIPYALLHRDSTHLNPALPTAATP